jgi:hypothetical protein
VDYSVLTWKLCRVMPPKPEHRRRQNMRLLGNNDDENGDANPPRPPPPPPPHMPNPMQFWAQATQFMNTMMTNMQTMQQQ